MTELEELIKYWRTSYQCNYTHRTPATNKIILSTIHYLKELLKNKGGLK